LGTPDELPQVIANLQVHGITVERVAVMQPMSRLSVLARDALLALERTSEVQVDWLIERLGFAGGADAEELDSSASSQSDASPARFTDKRDGLTLGRYGYVKRAFDIAAAALLMLPLAPVFVLVGLIVAIDVGLPTVFWQQRPGRGGRPFKLYKFCTMRAAHDSDGARIPDSQRITRIGLLLRRTRLDELPQLYNILVGEMSFVGPRPLLPWDQPLDATARLSVRPGLTGLAQVHGERDMSAYDKNALDICYIRNASIWLDFKILLRTILVLMRGEQVDPYALQIARDGVERSGSSEEGVSSPGGIPHALPEIASSAR
jgi:lipopolysaccharide/colanic/teichoic acid biosynthesis glycosyltransferase